MELYEKIFLVVIIFLLVLLILNYVLSQSKNHSKNDSKNQEIKKIIDPTTSIQDKNKYKKDGMHLIFSNEMNDMERVKHDFVFEEQPLGTLGTANQNYVNDENLIKINNNGLYLGVDITNYKELNKSNETKKTNRLEYKDKEKWNSTKITGRHNVRFCYGIIEARIRCPDIIGTWPAFWLNFCSGQYTPDKDKSKITLKGYEPEHPFICPMYWPPEIDIMERYNSNLNQAGFNQSSVHSANQVTMGAINNNSTPNQNQWCPQGVCDGPPTQPGPSYKDNKCPERKPGSGYCFGTSVFYRDRKVCTKEFITYKCVWSPQSVEFYMDDEYYGSLDYRSLALYKNGSVGPIIIPSVPMYPIFNTALLLQSYPGDSNDLDFNPNVSILSNLNADKNGSFKKDGMEIQWLRIYQDKNGTGLNPKITDSQKQTIMTNKSAIVQYSPVSNGNNICGEGKYDCLNTDPSKMDANYQNMFNNTCNILQNDYKDNFCLGLDAAIVANNAGIFDKSTSTTLLKTNAVTAYASDKYNLQCDDKLCSKMNYDVMPKEFVNSDWYNNYGYPEKKVSPIKPCSGVQSFDGKNLSNYKCV